MGRYEFEEELSDSDVDSLQDEIQTLSTACMPSTASDGVGIPSTSAPDTNDRDFSDEDDDDHDDDLELLRSIKEKYGLGDDIGRPLSLKPLFSLPPADSDDDEEDFETLRAIQMRFSQYGGDAGEAIERKNSSCLDKTLQNGAVDASLESEFLDDQRDDFRQEPCDAPQNVVPSNCSSSFPTAAQTFVEAIKKNRSCQKFIRNKMLHIEARMEEIKELQKRLKTLRDFQVQCKKTIGRAISQKQDARVQLTSAPKQRANIKGSDKNVSAIHYGPLENSHVALYKAALIDFPLSFQRDKWSKNEVRVLEKEIIQQFQERLFQKSADVLSALEESGFANGVDGMISTISKLEITPEIIQEFSGKVDWNQLASRLPRRSGAECEARWLNHGNCLINRDNWTSDEDKHLLLLIQKNGIHNWSYIAEKLETNRTPFQCLARYQRSLNASILKREWTEGEDAQLRSAVEAFGESNWQAVASVLEGRTGTQCSNRWRKTLLPARQRVGKWSINEDKRLRVAVTLFGYKNWHRIAQFVPGRTQAQCRERWVNVLDPCLNRGEWTEEDDLRLKTAITEYGYCWSRVAGCVPLRTDNQCRRRWKRLFPDEVPLLKAAKDLKKAALISNFVDREAERPALGANDFFPLPITDSTNEMANIKFTQRRKRKSRKAKSTIEFVSYSKGVGSRKRKRNDKPTGYTSESNTALSNDGYDNFVNEKCLSKSGSERKKRRGNLNITTKPKKSCESTKSHDIRQEETCCRDMPIRLSSARLKEICHCSVSNPGVHDTNMNATLVDCSNQNNGSEMLHGQSTSKSQLRLDDQEIVEASNVVNMSKNKRSSKLQLRRSSTQTSLGDDNYGKRKLRTSSDGNETEVLDAAGSSKHNAVKQQKKSELLNDRSLEWEDLPLAILFNKDVTRIQKRIPSVRPPILLTYVRRKKKGN